MHPWDSRESLLNHVGRLSQIGGISNFVHAEGKAKGTSTLRVRTAPGLELWIVPDRGMDIYEASFLCRSLCWHSPVGMVHPAYYSNRDVEWLKTFAGGLLTTCGLSTAGAPSLDGQERLGLHGPISNTPAENVTWSENWEGDDCIFVISGRVRESSVHGHNLLLARTISTSLRSTSVVINDLVENQGFQNSPLMVLYHFNFGFPLLTSRSRIYAPSKKIEAVDALSAETLNVWASLDTPKIGQRERVYLHEMEKDETGKVSVILVSDCDDPSFGIVLSYDALTLPQFIEWKMTSTNHFVLGLEPANCKPLGRDRERQLGTLQMLAPGEKREFQVELRVLDDQKQVADAIRVSNALPLEF